MNRRLRDAPFSTQKTPRKSTDETTVPERAPVLRQRGPLCDDHRAGEAPVALHRPSDVSHCTAGILRTEPEIAAKLDT